MRLCLSHWRSRHQDVHRQPLSSLELISLACDTQPVTIHWTKYRGPGAVTFTNARPALEILKGGHVTEPYPGRGIAAASFDEPGEYVLHATVNDYSGAGGGGEVCCWTDVMLKVRVTR